MLTQQARAGLVGRHVRYHVNRGIDDPSCPFCNLTETRKPIGPFICQNPRCRKEFVPAQYLPMNKGKAWQYCSRKCAAVHHGMLRPDRRDLVAEEMARWEGMTICAKCGQEYHPGIEGGERDGRACPECFPNWNRYREDHPLPESLNCSQCGASFKPVTANQQRCDDCGMLRRRWASIPHDDWFHPFAVFRRDGWKCQHCGSATPENLRGTLFENAPVLDHILPVSHGGAHTMANTQCLCWKCNGFKKDRIDREPRLVGVTDLTLYRKATYAGRAALRRKEEKICACGCGEVFTTWKDGNAEFKSGHWNKSAARRAAQRERMDGAVMRELCSYYGKVGAARAWPESETPHSVGQSL